MSGVVQSAEPGAIELAVARVLLGARRLAGFYDEGRSRSAHEERVRDALRSMGLTPPKSFRDLGVLFAREWDDHYAAIGQGRCVRAGMRWQTWHTRVCAPHDGACDPLPDV